MGMGRDHGIRITYHRYSGRHHPQSATCGMRDVILVLVSATVSAVGILYWLHDGDLEQAVEPVVNQWTAPQTDKNPTPKL